MSILVDPTPILIAVLFAVWGTLAVYARKSLRTGRRFWVVLVLVLTMMPYALGVLLLIGALILKHALFELIVIPLVLGDLLLLVAWCAVATFEIKRRIAVW